MKKIIHNIKTGEIQEVDFTAEDLAQVEIDKQREQARKQAEADAKAQAELEAQAKEANKASGNQKLLDLGLSQAEATALTGYTPPVE